MTSLQSFSVHSVNTHLIKLEREKFGLLKKMRSGDKNIHEEIHRLNKQIAQFTLVAQAFQKERK
jgi:hypothetical protein